MNFCWTLQTWRPHKVLLSSLVLQWHLHFSSRVFTRGFGITLQTRPWRNSSAAPVSRLGAFAGHGTPRWLCSRPEAVAVNICIRPVLQGLFQCSSFTPNIWRLCCWEAEPLHPTAEAGHTGSTVACFSPRLPAAHTYLAVFQGTVNSSGTTCLVAFTHLEID